MVAFLFQSLFAWMFFVGTTSAAAPTPASFHPFYLSVTEINHNAAEKSLEISCKFFADDFEHTLEKANKTSLDFAADKDKAALDGYIPDYVGKHLVLSVDGRPVKLSFLGFEREREAVYCYFEVQNIAAPKRVELFNNLLYDLTPEQINIMHITVAGKRQSGKLSHPETRTSFQF